MAKASDKGERNGLFGQMTSLTAHMSRAAVANLASRVGGLTLKIGSTPEPLIYSYTVAPGLSARRAGKGERSVPINIYQGYGSER